MNNEMRLFDFIYGYARYYELDVPEAAHALHKLIDDLFQQHCVLQGKIALPSDMFWVGRADSSRRSIRTYKLFFRDLINYLDSLFDSVPNEGYDLIHSYCEDDKGGKDIPVSLIYLSKKALAEWIEGFGGTAPVYLLLGESGVAADHGRQVEELQVKELNSISLIISGLVNLIKEVDKAHVELSDDVDAVKRADAIKRRAAALRSPRKNVDVFSAVLALADAAEVEMPKSQKTLKKYMSARLTDGAEGAA
ncbi:hypothetical protein BWR59_16075 [Pseudomonas sp. Bc-h]|uniref:hypothetical protein n=1 Tax=Pseudomonas sp. Bc-h TaxID=1943632 RepID=UPI0009DB005A|nr:hypothetical protein [Pseudomonas sp. Bc-h]OQR31025.1 hypothetical protein BWR59_16075 [Pseudomonas sp. Bc-h]